MIDKKQMLYGVLLGAIVPPIAFVSWVLLLTDYSVDRAIDLVVKGSLFSEVLSLSAIANMIIFYISLNKNKIFLARGILLITIFLAFVVLITKFI